MKRKHAKSGWFHDWIFSWLYRRSLVFNTCWEDPAVDRAALQIGRGDNVLVITSAGCNALAYALDSPRNIFAVDANPRQTALLELKIAGIRALPFDAFFEIFAFGRHPGFRRIYGERLRGLLTPCSREYWDRRCACFCGTGWRDRFYWHGLTGLFARLFRVYVNVRPRLRRALDELLESSDLDAQRATFRERIDPALWDRATRWALRRAITATLLGIPRAQREQIEDHFGGDLSEYIRAMVRQVFERVPIQSNYFWSVYLRGHYTRDCCPDYLTEDGFRRLKGGLVDCIHPQTATVTELLRATSSRISKFVLLDHMDWMDVHDPRALAEEWEHIFARAASGARLIFRSGAARPAFLDRLIVRAGQGPSRLVDLLEFRTELAEVLNRSDRVGTYASLYIADVRRRWNVPLSCPAMELTFRTEVKA